MRTVLPLRLTLYFPTWEALLLVGGNEKAINFLKCKIRFKYFLAATFNYLFRKHPSLLSIQILQKIKPLDLKICPQCSMPDKEHSAKF
jgi:hypothetical protein